MIIVNRVNLLKGADMLRFAIEINQALIEKWKEVYEQADSSNEEIAKEIVDLQSEIASAADSIEVLEAVVRQDIAKEMVKLKVSEMSQEN